MVCGKFESRLCGVGVVSRRLSASLIASNTPASAIKLAVAHVGQVVGSGSYISRRAPTITALGIALAAKLLFRIMKYICDGRNPEYAVSVW